MRLNPNYRCKCGHKVREHLPMYYKDSQKWCDKCEHKRYHVIELDNLSMLEELSEYQQRRNI